MSSRTPSPKHMERRLAQPYFFNKEVMLCFSFEEANDTGGLQLYHLRLVSVTITTSQQHIGLQQQCFGEHSMVGVWRWRWRACLLSVVLGQRSSRGLHLSQETSSVYLDHAMLANGFAMCLRAVALVLLEPVHGPALAEVNLHIVRTERRLAMEAVSSCWG